VESAISIMQFLQSEQVTVSSESKLLEASKSSAQMIWTLDVRLHGSTDNNRTRRSIAGSKQ
jgi:hypothetical protein